MVHAIRYPEFIEDAFLAWLDDNHLPYSDLQARQLDLVIGHLEIRYRSPARLGEEIKVTTNASRWTKSTLRVEFDIGRDDAVLAEGSVTYITVRDGKSTPLPEELRTDE